MKTLRPILTTMFACALSQMVYGSEAIVRTPAPVIHLEANLDEAQGLGFCIDTVGRGWSDQVHAHSCKPQGGDVQFSLDTTLGRIMPVAFPDTCLTASGPGAPTVFGLIPCDGANPAQRFGHDPDRRALFDAGDPDRCIAVGATSHQAGPFQSRNLLWADCDNPEPALRRWVVLP